MRPRCGAIISTSRLWSAVNACCATAYAVKTPTRRSPSTSGVLNALPIFTPRSWRSSAASEFEIVCRQAATHPLSRSPIAMEVPASAPACSPVAWRATRRPEAVVVNVKRAGRVRENPGEVSSGQRCRVAKRRIATHHA